MDFEKGVTEFETCEEEPQSSIPNDPSNPNIEPFVGMEFDSEPSARIFYNSYARRAGFSIRAHKCQRARRDGSLVGRQIVCSREGFRREMKDGRGPTRQHSVTRVGCKARMTVKKKNPSGKWYITKLVKEHNHELVPPDKVHRLRSHRRITGPARSLIDTLHAAGMGAAEVMAVLIKESGGADNVGFTKVDCQNYMSNSKQKSLGSGSQSFFDYLRQMQDENPGFYCAVQDGDFVNSTTGNVFWADADARKNYSCFGDTVVFDMTYRRDDYRVPFAPFTGLNYHGQPVLFGCALIVNESETSFIWLFQTFLDAMSGKHPVSITTDNDRIIHSAILEVFPRTRHRFCKWNVIWEAQERLSDLYHVNCNFEADFLRCINATETIDEFESSWKSLLQRYELVDNEWLHSMYKSRQQWVSAYLRDTFFGELSVTQGSDNTDSYFDGYINALTTIQELIKQYEKAIASRYENEMKADYETLNTAPVLKTPSPMEKQAASIYTRKPLAKFQDELVETLAYAATAIDDTRLEVTYRVEKFGEVHKALLVRFNVFDKKASCSCQLFEFAGIICRHILAVFRVANVLTLPLHYILKRWTRNAKSGILLDEHSHWLQSNPLDTFAARCDSLRHEVMRYVENGVESKDTYSVAMDALREASKKVATAKKLGPGLPQNVSDNNIHEIQPGTTDEDKKIQELTTELQSATQRCEAYRQNLVGLLKIMEEQKLKVSVEVHNFRLNLQAESVNLNDS